MILEGLLWGVPPFPSSKNKKNKKRKKGKKKKRERGRTGRTICMAFAFIALDCFSSDTTGCYSLTQVNYIPSHTSHFPERERGRTRRTICMAFALIALDSFNSDTTGCCSLTHVNYILSHTFHFLALGKPKKKEAMRIYTSGAACPHSRTCTRNLGVAPLMLWTPLIQRRLLDHRVLLTLDFDPCPLALASFPIWLHHDALLLHLRGYLGFSECDVGISLGFLVYRVLYSFIFVSLLGDCDHPVARACRGKKWKKRERHTVFERSMNVSNAHACRRKKMSVFWMKSGFSRFSSLFAGFPTFATVFEF